MEGKYIVITGASDGIGAEAARQLHHMGAKVVIIGRSPEKTKRVAEELGANSFVADFSRLDDVRKLAHALEQTYPHIDVLVNNAGGIFGKREVTVDGHEKTMQVNHLAHFLLTKLLMDTLLSSKATVVNTSSVANELFSDLDINDLDLEQSFTPNKAYGNAKLANILFTKELQNRYHTQGLAAVAFHPGNVSTNFANDTTSFFRFVYRTPLAKLILLSPSKGADTLVWLASSTAGKDWKPGEYYVKRKVAKAHQRAYDTKLAHELWEASERLTQPKVQNSSR